MLIPFSNCKDKAIIKITDAKTRFGGDKSLQSFDCSCISIGLDHEEFYWFNKFEGIDIREYSF